MLRTVNRVLLALAGLILVALGGSVLAVAFGVSPPSWWIHRGPHDVLLSDAERTHWRDQGWWWPAVIAALAVLLMLALWWLIMVLRRRRVRQVVVDTGDGGVAQVRGPALEDALGDEAAGLDGVDRARVRLNGRRTAPHTDVRLLLAPYVHPAQALDGLTYEVLEQARESTGLRRLPAVVRLRAVRHRAERVA